MSKVWSSKFQRMVELSELTANHEHSGRTIIEIIWEEMDSAMDKLFGEFGPENVGYNANEPVDDMDPEDAIEFGEARGNPQGLAYALAVMTNPYTPDVPAIKKQAYERWQARNSE